MLLRIIQDESNMNERVVLSWSKNKLSAAGSNIGKLLYNQMGVKEQEAIAWKEACTRWYLAGIFFRPLWEMANNL
jgi:hypothetical protein